MNIEQEECFYICAQTYKQTNTHTRRRQQCVYRLKCDTILWKTGMVVSLISSVKCIYFCYCIQLSTTSTQFEHTMKVIYTRRRSILSRAKTTMYLQNLCVLFLSHLELPLGWLKQLARLVMRAACHQHELIHHQLLPHLFIHGSGSNSSCLFGPTIPGQTLLLRTTRITSAG